MKSSHPNIRFIEPPQSHYIDRPSKGTSILFLASNPKNTTKLQLTEEFQEIQKHCPYDDDEWDLNPQFDLSPGEILPLLLPHKKGEVARPKILHFSGHGVGENGLMFVREDGKAQAVDGAQLASMLQNFSESISCVVLNACYSEEQAKVIAQYIPNVVGTDNAIGDKKAIEFSEAFYLSLFRGESYENAFKMALAHISIQSLDKGAQPVFYRWEGAEIFVPPVAEAKIEKEEAPVIKEEPKTAPISTEPKSNTALIVGIVVLAIIALVAILWGAGVFSAKEDNKTKDPEVVETNTEPTKNPNTNKDDIFDLQKHYHLSNEFTTDNQALALVGENQVVMFPKQGVAGQAWKFTAVTDGYYKMTTSWKGENICLTAKSQEDISAAEFINSDKQLWKVAVTKSGYYEISNKAMGKNLRLDVLNDKQELKKLMMAKKGKFDGQVWTFKEFK